MTLTPSSYLLRRQTINFSLLHRARTPLISRLQDDSKRSAVMLPNALLPFNMKSFQWK